MSQAKIRAQDGISILQAITANPHFQAHGHCSAKRKEERERELRRLRRKSR